MGRRACRDEALNPIPIWLASLIGGGLGVIIGSFVATLVIRWPQRMAVTGRSRCDACGVTLTVRDLIPLAGYALNRAKCRHCGAAIDPQHPIIEILCAAAGSAAMIASPDWAGVAGLALGCLLVAIAALDFAHFWLPDKLTVVLAATGLAGGVLGLDPPLIDRVIGGVTGFVALWGIAALYRLIRKREGLGGGDPKLLGAIGTWLGWQALPLVIVGASLMGLGWTLWLKLRGQNVAATDRLALGGLMAAAAFPIWLGSAWVAQ